MRISRLLALGVTLAARPSDNSDDCGMFRGGPEHLGVYHSANSTLRQVTWRFRTGDPVVSSPLAHGDAICVGSSDPFIHAVNRRTGALRWKFETRGPVNSSPAFSMARCTHSASTAGSTRWMRRQGASASPAVADGVVYIGSWDRNMYALDATTGKERLRFQTGDDTTIYNQVGIASSAAVSNGVVYFGCRDGYFYALTAATGLLRRRHDNMMGWVIASPAVVDGVVYFPTSDGTRFKALDAATGALRYSVENKAVSFSSPAVVTDVANVGSSDGWLHGVDLRTGAPSARFQSDGSRHNAAKYIDENGRIKSSALYPDFTLDGMIIGVHRMFTLGSILSSPVVMDGTLYVGSTDRNIYALR